jgi:hypothetical protein
MYTLFSLNAPLLSAEPLASDHGPDFLGMLLRIVLFLLFLLVFVFACGYAWRTFPALRAILPLPEKRVTEQLTLNLPPLPDDEQVEVYSYSSLEPDGEGFRPSSNAADPLAEAIADGRPGAVIQAASDPDGSFAPPILFVRREDSSPN